jgi:anti-repressor protein
MNQLIKIEAAQVGDATVQTVNARDLHGFLESGQEFRHWIKARIEQYEFAENQDFTTSENFIRGGKATDYHLTIDMAKELAMVERNAKGKEARQYFIECERQAKAVALSPANLSRMQLIELAMQSEQERLLLEAQVAEQAPKVEIHDRISESVSTLCIRDAAKTLQVQPGKLTTWLVMNKWIYHRAGKSGYLAYQDRIQAGHLVHKSTPYKDLVTGDDKISEQVRITGLGLTTLARRLTDDAAGLLGANRKKGGPQPPSQGFIQ